MIADILLVSGAFAAALYCFVLGRRLKKFTNLEKGVGGAVSVLSAQVEELNASLEAARAVAHTSVDELEHITLRAEQISKRLELQLAGIGDLPDADLVPQPTAPPLQTPMFTRRVPESTAQ